ncbi:ATP-binding protein [Paractinoplanes brasiliensis]|uniref:Oxygen sensor histidine kinase NreB n=1 Tax=Paractinoplanes brasiliensis TaxID=52695 RepID=A0A4R6JWA9_9ACTN|nr:ATP-binding protein [Actinoplanes brasiliensis]TDO39901.1 signal transduction histidine kinase [Actinoplanes brasiliensis]GID31521.1 hypothetical protein Abr02nite_65040 [Actinoplanes brasiliensis]
MRRWLLIAAFVLVTVVGVAFRTVETLQWHPTQPPGVFHSPLALELAKVLPAVAWSAAGCALAVLRPRNTLGWLFLAFGAVQAFATTHRTLTVYRPTDPPETLATRIADMFSNVTVWGLLTVVLALYPDGRLPSRRWRVPMAAAIAGLVLMAAYDVGDWDLGFLDVLIQVLLMSATAMILIGTIRRWHRAVYPYRQQLGWFLMGLAGAFALNNFAAIGGFYALGNALFTPLLIMPIAVAFGVLHYRLLDVRVVLRRGLVYGALTVLVFGVYLLLTAVFTSALGRVFPGVLAGMIVAAGLLPARDWIQRGVDRLIYGARLDPLRALNDLGKSVATTDQSGLLPTAVAAVAASVQAEGATVISPDGRTLARTGIDVDSHVAFPLRFGGREIGELRIATPQAGEHYSTADRRLLTALAAQLAVVASATELTEALETERNRVVEATRNERDRLRRDLHDGLGPSLAGMSLGLQALTSMVPAAPAARLVERLRAETDVAVKDIRRIIDGLRPSVLDTIGLAQAIQRHAGALNATLPVEVNADGLPTLTPDVETAAYRIVTEALTNVARHAHAHHARVAISASDALHIAVSDDGRGIHPTSSAGVGLTSMRRRAEALGGGFAVRTDDAGTTITATLPLRRA